MSSCPSGLPGTDLLVGEELISTVRIVTTLVSITVTSAWFSKEKIKKLSLFFAHWLSGLVAGMVVLAEGTMVSACWTGREFAGLMRALKFIGLSAFNMYAITNLAICINLAFIVSSHRTLSRVRSVTSPRLLLAFVFTSVALAAPVLALAETVRISRTGFHVTSLDEGKNPYVKVSFFYVEMFVGICMFVVGGWLLLFRLNEAKETWKIHVRIRFYFVLTLIGIAVNITVGVCGVINFLADDIRYLPIMLSATFRYMHIALDTLALYGALRDKTTDGGSVRSSTQGACATPKPMKRRSGVTPVV